jgi:hypothetical protein
MDDLMNRPMNLPVTLNEAIQVRHSVRQYIDRPLGQKEIEALKAEIQRCNQESGLHIQLVLNEPKAFDGFMAHYGSFRGVTNYIALIGKKGSALEEACGYYGERMVLLAQQLGLNTCWVALTYSKVNTAYEIGENEKLCAVIALGYGATQGTPHKLQDRSNVMKVSGEAPDWFQNGITAALLAPTAVNQQKFRFELEGNTVKAEAGRGFYTKLDLGIVKYHFEVGAGKENFIWANG